MMKSGQRCARPGCGRKLENDTQIACPLHWNRLPESMRNRLALAKMEDVASRFDRAMREAWAHWDRQDKAVKGRDGQIGLL